MGANSRPTRSVPRCWIANSSTMIASVTGTTMRVMPGLSSSRPSTAPSTEMAGVISASQ